MNRISVVIVTFNSASTIKACIDSIIKFSSGCEVIVVDNNSEDITCEIVQEFGKRVKLIKASTNLGFAKANNLGVKSAIGEYFIFLNPDTEIIQKYSLNRLKIILEKNPEFGIIGPKLMYPDGLLQARVRNLPTVFNAFKEYILGKKGEYDFYSPNCKTLCEVESVIGACMIIKKELFQKVGGFNEKYFMYFEDLELCRQVRFMGLKVGFLPEVIVEHAEGKSGVNQQTGVFLHDSAKKYHGLISYFLIQLIIKLGVGKKSFFWITCSLLGAAFFRILFLDLIEFKLDEATTVYQTVQFFINPYIIQRGLISGIGVHNFPLFNYLVVLLAIFSRDPQFISFLIALINTILVPIFYIFIKRYYDPVTAIFASFLLAFSPWAIIFSRKIWAQDLILLLFLPFFALLHEIILKKKTKFTTPLFILLVLLIQLHASGLFLILSTIFIFIILRIKINLWQAMIGILIGLIPAIPYVIFQLTANPVCPDCDAFFKYQQTIRSFDIYAFIRPFQLMNGQGYHFILGNNYDDFISFFPFLNTLKHLFLSSFIIPLVGVFFIITKKREYLFLVLYVTFIPLLYFVTRTTPYMHYFVILIPIVVTIYAISFSGCYYLAKTKLLKTIVSIIFSCFIISNIIFLYYFYQFLSLSKVIDGDYGPIFSYTKGLTRDQIYLKDKQ